MGSDPYKLYPFGEFQKQLQKFGKFGVLNASFALPVIMQEIDFNTGSKPSQSNKNQNDKQMSDSFKKRLRDIVSDSHELGYIWTLIWYGFKNFIRI